MNFRIVGTTRTGLLAFKVLGRWKKVRYTLSYIVCLGLLSQCFVSCAGGRFAASGKGNKYVYSYALVTPVRNPRLIFQNDSLKIQFRIDASTIQFQLQNLSHGNISIVWRDASIGVENKFACVRNSLNMYSDTGQIRGSGLIPPLGYVQELAIPAKSVAFDGKQWTESDLLPTTDGNKKATAAAIARNVGTSIVFMLPLQFGSVRREYRFEFKVVSVRQIAWKNYRPPKRNPPPLPKQPRIQNSDVVTSAIIIVGLLGFVGLMASLKKTPVAE